MWWVGGTALNVGVIANWKDERNIKWDIIIECRYSLKIDYKFDQLYLLSHDDILFKKIIIT